MVQSASHFSKQDHTVGQTDVPQHLARSVVLQIVPLVHIPLLIIILKMFFLRPQQMILYLMGNILYGLHLVLNQFKILELVVQVLGLIAGTPKTLTTSWARYTHTFTFGSVSGKTIGTAADSSSFEIGFWLSGGSDYNARTGSIGNQAGTFEISHVQLENGPTVTPFENLTQSETLLLCQKILQ